MKPTMNFDSSTENATLIATGAALADPVTVGEGKPFVVVPNNFRVQDLENTLPKPARKRGAAVLLDRLSFAQYVNLHAEKDSTHLYANVDYQASKCVILAVLDDHSATDASWRTHTASFAPNLAVEWTRWNSSNGKAMSQSVFAAFLEDNLPDIASVDGMPTASEMLQMALSFELTSDKRFKRKVDLQGGGVAFEFVDQADNETSTKMAVFQRFTIGVPVFDGSSHAYPVEARLKYRTTDAGLSFWYELVRPDRVFRTAVTDEFEAITQATGMTIMRGTPGPLKQSQD